jgi:hypothetical protein
LDKVSNFCNETLIFADFFINFYFSSHVAWSVSCPEGRIEEGKPSNPFVFSFFSGIFSLKNRQKSAFHYKNFRDLLRTGINPLVKSATEKSWPKDGQ